MSTVLDRLFVYLPRGGSLPCDVWKKRHRALGLLLRLHVPGVFAVGVATGHDWLHVALECVALVACAVAAGLERVHRNVRMIAISIGLLTASGLLVHLTGGVIEMHFHFFVVVAAVTLYQAWLPFLIAIAYVVGHHGVIGVLDAASVYNHPAAIANPWKWAFVHGLFILGECVALLVVWRMSEDFRDAAQAEYESRLKEEDARLVAQDEYRRIFENSMEGIYETTTAGFIMTANPALARILGYESADVMTGKSIASHYVHPDERSRFLKLLDENNEVIGFEFEARRVDGTPLWLSISATTVRDERGNLVSIQGMLENISKRKDAEFAKHLEESNARLKAVQVERENFLNTLLESVEAERVRIAAELHDRPIQHLTALNYDLALAKLCFEDGDIASGIEELEQFEVKLSEQIEGLRKLMAELRPPALDQAGLMGALQDHLADFERRSSVACALDVRLGSRLDASVETVLYRVTQEALTNVMKHAQADRVDVSVVQRDGEIVLQIRDDGVGFAPDDLSCGREHFGTTSMERRVDLAGGRFSISSSPGLGTLVEARFDDEASARLAGASTP